MAAIVSITHEPSRVFFSLGRWIRTALQADVPVTRDQMDAWAKAAEVAAARAAVLESQVAAAGGSPRERIDEARAEVVYEQALQSVVRISALAMQAATKDELRQLDADACLLVDALEAFGLGVVRPSENTTLKGA